MTSAYPFAFDAEITTHDVGSSRYLYTVLWVPDGVAARLPLAEYPRLRVTGEIGEHPFEAALTPVRGRWYILLSKALLKAVGAQVGDSVEVRFEVGDQAAVDVPPTLKAALAEHTAMRALWEAETPGKQRGLAYRVASAKSEATRARRVEEVFAILRGERDLRGNPRS
ncbi:MAG: YdeI/OmpD-associated family protein [Pseudomonadota bacterium]